MVRRDGVFIIKKVLKRFQEVEKNHFLVIQEYIFCLWGW